MLSSLRSLAKSAPYLDVANTEDSKQLGRKIQFTDLSGDTYMYKIKDMKKLRVSRNGVKQGWVHRIKLNKNSFSDRYNTVVLPLNSSGEAIISQLSRLCREVGVPGMERAFEAIDTTELGKKWTVHYPNGVYVRKTFSTKADIVGRVYKGDQIEEIESKKIDDELWVRHEAGWTLAMCKEPESNVESILLKPDEATRTGTRKNKSQAVSNPPGRRSKKSNGSRLKKMKGKRVKDEKEAKQKQGEEFRIIFDHDDWKFPGAEFSDSKVKKKNLLRRSCSADAASPRHDVFSVLAARRMNLESDDIAAGTSAVRNLNLETPPSTKGETSSAMSASEASTAVSPKTNKETSVFDTLSQFAVARH
mmetsp:Transcript_7073/g.9828  ORF Transcript_7073/g.9828 Transcript_7073/m.9828 type:complete len:361 (+) Transcript_7073:79-1161(+)